jgi:hypothetical protein
MSFMQGGITGRGGEVGGGGGKSCHPSVLALLKIDHLARGAA